MTPNVRNQICANDSFPGKVADFARAKAQVARGARLVPTATALEELADFVSTRDLADHRLIALWHYQGGSGRPRTEYHPGPAQEKLLSLVGRDMGRTVPDSENFLNELVCAAMEDIIQSRQHDLSGASEARERAEKALQKAVPHEERADLAEVKLERAKREIAERDERVAELEARVQLLMDGEHDVSRGAFGRRRKRVEGEPNLFVNVNRAGEEVYEVVYQVEGKKRHETIGLDLDQALARREELRAEGTIKTPEVAA